MLNGQVNRQMDIRNTHYRWAYIKTYRQAGKREDNNIDNDIWEWCCDVAIGCLTLLLILNILDILMPSALILC